MSNPSTEVLSALNRHLEETSFESLSEAALETCGLNSARAESDAIWIQRTLESLEVAASLGDLKAIKALHAIASGATEALNRVTRPVAGLPVSAGTKDLDWDVLRVAVAQIDKLDKHSLTTLRNQTQQASCEDDTFLPLAERLYPSRTIRTDKQRIALSIVNSVIQQHLTAKSRPLVERFIKESATWPNFSPTHGGKQLRATNARIPAGLGLLVPRPLRMKSGFPEAPASFAHYVYNILRNEKASPSEKCLRQSETYAAEIGLVEKYLYQVARQERKVEAKRGKLVKPEGFGFYADLRWRLFTHNLLEFSEATVGAWTAAGIRWIEFYCEGDLHSVDWPGFISNRRGNKKPTLATIREVLKTQFTIFAKSFSQAT